MKFAQMPVLVYVSYIHHKLLQLMICVLFLTFSNVDEKMYTVYRGFLQILKVSGPLKKVLWETAPNHKSIDIQVIRKISQDFI